ncbi:TetR/AcrR family transcriptional regulator [Acetonema longum]|uniref:TetR family transcriptional regulator n=1 Tax=Acetonema longum DSM 6540 TaxID=1009370 RepID=F7NET6_9FIRM|nr:TetR/AcrR family transcriptional regulator [Acetonema longum]EGO65497.1 TetR family transcriptional regulator [Acetonema longum DSM 6540]
MDTALELFLSQGYQQTLISDIVKKVGVAQGTFYYYFASKEAVLEAIIAHHIKHMMTAVQKTEWDQTAPLEQLQLFVNHFYKLHYTGSIGLLGKVLYRENQGVLINRLWRQTHISTKPLLVQILEHCNQAGATQVTRMDETLGFFSGIIGSLLEASSPLEFGHESNPDVMKHKRRIAERLLESLFDTPAGSIYLEEVSAQEP